MGGNKRKLGFIPGSDNATTHPICWKETMTREVGRKKRFEFGGGIELSLDSWTGTIDLEHQHIFCYLRDHGHSTTQ
jgi:hypothetical protein